VEGSCAACLDSARAGKQHRINKINETNHHRRASFKTSASPRGAFVREIAVLEFTVITIPPSRLPARTEGRFCRGTIPVISRPKFAKIFGGSGAQNLPPGDRVDVRKADYGTLANSNIPQGSAAIRKRSGSTSTADGFNGTPPFRVR
jgi:hypothetical protein